MEKTAMDNYNSDKYKQFLYENTKVKNQFFTAFTASLTVIIASALQSWITAEIPKRIVTSHTTRDGFTITQSEADFILAVIPAAAILGPILNVYFINKIGRKITLTLIKIEFTIAICYLFFVNDYTSLMIASFLLIINPTIATSVVNVYISEIASPKLRGSLCGAMLVMGTVAAIIGFAISSMFDVTESAIIFLGFIVITIIPEIFIPKSPYFLLQHDKQDEARKAIAFLYRNDIVESELKRLTRVIEKSRTSQANIVELWKNRAALRALLLNLTFNIAYSFSGMSISDYLMASLLQNGCYKLLDPDLCEIIIMAASLVITILTAYLLSIVPRRIMHISSTLAIAAGLLATAAYYYLITINDSLAGVCDFLPFGLLLPLNALYPLGVSSMPVVYFRELMPSNFVATATFVCDIAGPAVSWIAVLTFEFIQNFWSLSGAFIFFAFVTIICLYIFIRWIPEARDKFMEEVIDDLND